MAYQLKEEAVLPEDFVRLREVSGLSPRTIDAARRGLEKSLYAVTVVLGDKTVGMGRVIGDGALNFEVVDIAVDPEHQGQGLGRMIMESIMTYLRREVPKQSYVSLIGDVPPLYEKFGFKLVRPASEGMYWKNEDV